jgi:hypothetical protein
MDMARFQLKPDDIIIERRPDAEYEKLFPYYVELCAASQFRSKLTGEGGGPAGHAILYFKGACKDEDAPFPQLRRCRRVATSLKDPEHGAGVSVNQMFKNINWVATPGYDLVFPGGLAPGERLTLARFEAIEQTAIAKDIYKGVTFHRFAGAASDTDLRDFLPRAGIGTDLALQFARSVFCARLPVTEAMLDPIIIESTAPRSAPWPSEQCPWWLTLTGASLKKSSPLVRGHRGPTQSVARARRRAWRRAGRRPSRATSRS